MPNPTITYSLFPDESARTRTQRSLPWSEFVQLVREPIEYQTKASQPLVKLATFGESRTPKGCVRHDANVLRVHGVEADYDAERVPMADTARRLQDAGIEALLVTSASHKPEAPRYRIFAPLSKPCRPEARRELLGVLNTLCGGELAAESFTLSQSYYFGRVRGVPYETLHVDGAQCLDDVALFHEPTYPASDHEEHSEEPMLSDEDRSLLFADVTDETMAEVRSAVASLKPHRYEKGSYLAWREIIWGLKSLGFAGRDAEAKAIALEFSQRGGDAFDAEGFERCWRELPKRTTYKTVIHRAQQDGWGNPRSGRPAPDRADGGRVDMTDSGNVNALFEETRGDLRYIVERKCFMQWDGLAWNVDESGSAAASATKLVAERYLRSAKKLEADADAAAGEDRKRLLKLAESHRSWANYCRNRRGMDNMLALAARDDRFAIGLANLDTDRWAFGAANGVIDLRSGELRPSARGDFITRRSPYRFNIDARAPRFEQFVGQITARPAPGGGFTPRPGLAKYLHRAVGYWATGSVEEHKMFVAVGEGSNGKSVLVDVLAEVLGPYAVAIPPDVMMSTSRENDGERPTPFARRLAGARLAYGSEAREGQKLSSAWVKKQTGDARLTARGLQENAFTFDTTHKLVLLTNHEPHLDHLDAATRGRLHTIPFDARWNRPGVPDRDPNLPDGDKHLMQRLIAEAEGILLWVVQGAVAYAREGLEPPADVAARTREYFAEQDCFAQWVATMQRCAAKVGTAAAALFTDFQAFCAGEGISSASPGTQRAFAKALQLQGIPSERVSTGTVWGLRAPDADIF
ncbi:DNA primase family protein [Ramlibacter alkalitolerans]|uniref:SF3 helicase domain-containing protein n=1 Tax=Ramlibacter alkalitolerans TaxID=2039631 RepID=A0ABS1JUK9_9BURK|nr:phage/plasmid primase, P4 family [Ramlibacter alkalitolerans]MBL0427938.1 hypothetical protein [Ramlibacter alkalitolerans]